MAHKSHGPPLAFTTRRNTANLLLRKVSESLFLRRYPPIHRYINFLIKPYQVIFKYHFSLYEELLSQEFGSISSLSVGEIL